MVYSSSSPKIYTRFTSNKRINNVITNLAKLIKLPDLQKMSDKSIGGLKWKIIEEVLKG